MLQSTCIFTITVHSTAVLDDCLRLQKVCLDSGILVVLKSCFFGYPTIFFL